MTIIALEENLRYCISMEIFLFTDWASRWNPGKSWGGFIAFNKNKKILFTWKKYFWIKTNNQSEYMALIEWIKASIKYWALKINIFLDSELITRQLEWRYKVKNKDLKSLYWNVIDSLWKTIWTVKHIRREFNKDADRLANEAVDSGAV